MRRYRTWISVIEIMECRIPCWRKVWQNSFSRAMHAFLRADVPHSYRRSDHWWGGLRNRIQYQHFLLIRYEGGGIVLLQFSFLAFDRFALRTKQDRHYIGVDEHRFLNQKGWGLSVLKRGSWWNLASRKQDEILHLLVHFNLQIISFTVIYSSLVPSCTLCTELRFSF